MLARYTPYLFNEIRLLLAVGITLLLVTACQTSKVKDAPILVTQHAPVVNGKPSIKSITDLGGLSIENGGGIPVHLSDGKIYPGEWIYVKGNNMGVSSVDIDGRNIPISKYFGDGFLVRVPTGLSPLKKHKLSIDNEQGSSNAQFSTHHYIATTDTDGKKTYLIRTNAEERGGVEEEWLELDNSAERPMFNLFSDDSRFLYTFDVKDNSEEKVIEDQASYVIEVNTFHVAAPGAPRKVASFSVVIGSPISEVKVLDNKLLLLGRSTLNLIDATDPLHLKNLSSVILPQNNGKKTAYIDADFIDGGKRLVLLEIYSNALSMYELDSQNTLQFISNTKLLPNTRIPLTVDLEVNPKNDKELWVLVGPNQRLTGSVLSDTYKRIFNLDHDDLGSQIKNYLQKITVSGDNLIIDRTVATPDNHIAYFSIFGQDGRLYLPTTNTGFFPARRKVRKRK